MATIKKKAKSGSKTAEVSRQEYEPGVELKRPEPVEEGDYKVTLKSKGKEGMKGWRSKNPAKKFPYRMTQWNVLDTEDEETGDPKTVRFCATSSPKAFAMFHALAVAAGYPNKLSLPVADANGKKIKPGHPLVKKRCEEMDKVIDFIEENELILNASISIGEFNGEPQNDIRFRPPDDDEAEGEEGEESEETEESEDTEDESESEEGDEESEETEEGEDEGDEESDEEESEEESEDEDTEGDESDESEEETEEVEEEEEIDHSPKGKGKKGSKADVVKLAKGKGKKGSTKKGAKK